jgi:hypothetical protein
VIDRFDLNAAGFVIGIEANVPAHVVDRGVPDLFVKTQQGETTAWDVASMSPHGDWVTLELRSSAVQYRPKVNDEVALFYDDVATGGEDVLDRTVVVPPPHVAIVDGHFVSWSQTPQGLIPVGWSADVDLTSHYAVDHLRGSEGGVAMRISPVRKKSPQVQSVALSQDVKIPNSRVRVRFRPKQQCSVAPPSKGGNIVNFAGFGVADQFGRELLFCVANVPQERIVELPGSLLALVTLPGRVNQWNDVTIDMRKYAAYVRLTPDSYGRLVVQVLDAVVSTEPRSTSSRADFASVDSTV